MPIYDMRFEDGIFSAREVGKVDKPDAEAWVKALREHASTSPTPIVALIDAREVGDVSSSASLVFLHGSSTPNVKVAVVVASTKEVVVKAQSISLMSGHHKKHDTRVFYSLDEAQTFARRALEKTT